jgi:hypothetical protein
MRSPKQKIAVLEIAELRDELRRVAQTLALLVTLASEGEAASFTVKKFLARNDLSESQYHKLRRQGRGPRVMSVGSCGVRISRQAELDWIAAREIAAEAAKEIAATENETSAPEEERPSDGPSNCPQASGESSANRRKLAKCLAPVPEIYRNGSCDSERRDFKIDDDCLF